MKNIYYLLSFCLFMFSSFVAKSEDGVSETISGEISSEENSCDKGYIKYKDKCVQDCDKTEYPLVFAPDANRGEIAKCEGKTTRYKFLKCNEDYGWYWDDGHTECLPAPCVGYPLNENELNKEAGNYESCVFYGRKSYKFISCNPGWDGPKNGKCILHKCSPREYPYSVKAVANTVCADTPITCQEGSLSKRYGCNGKCGDDYYYSKGFCYLSNCGESYPYTTEEEAVGCKKLRFCNSVSLKPAFGCDLDFGCKEGYYQDKFRCIPNTCNDYSSESADISNCEEVESCLRGANMVYKCKTCNQGYELIDDQCKEISLNKDTPEKTKSVCHVGDIYYSDATCHANDLENKTPIGIVVDPKNKLIMALSFESKHWDTFDSNKGYDIPSVVNIPIVTNDLWSNSVQQAAKDLNGAYNSDKFIEYEQQIHVRFPAIEYCNDLRIGHKKWFIPSAGQLLLLEKNRELLNAALSKINDRNIGQYSLLNSFIWSSTEASLPCSEDDNCYNPNSTTFISKPKHMIALKPVKGPISDDESSSHLDYISKYFAAAPTEGVYALCFADYESHDIRGGSIDCTDYPFYNENSESIYTNINEMFASGRIQKASELESCTDSYGTWYKPITCPKGYTLDKYGCYPTDCSMYRGAPTSENIEGCRHFVACETPSTTYYICDLCERPYELTREYTCILK